MNREPLSIERIKFENPGVYRIVVQGSLGENWSDRLAGMQITTSSAGKRDTEEGMTTLVGYLRDQTQLSGVLNGLLELHLPILLVEHLEPRVNR
jgi:hypothetical protein